MTISRTFVAAVAFAGIAAGCASNSNSSNDNPAPASSTLVYRTGSNIPIRESKPATKEEKERQAEDAQRFLARPVGAGAPIK